MAKSNYEWINRNAVTVDGKSPFFAKDAASKFTYTEGGGMDKMQSAQAMQRPNIPGYNPNKPIIFEPPSFQGTGGFPPQMGGFTPMDMQQLHQQCQAFPAPYSPQGAGPTSQGMPPAYIMPPQNYMPPQGAGMQGQFMPQPQMPFSMPPGGGMNWM